MISRLTQQYPRYSFVIETAFEFASNAHQGQVRKYTGEPYINHPVEVAHIVASAGGTHQMVCAALLHDVIEDCGVTQKELSRLFDDNIVHMVVDLTDISKPSDGNREARKGIDRYNLSKAWPESKTVKLADLISNTSTIAKHDPEFAKTYMKEKALLLEVLGAGDRELLNRCKSILSDWKANTNSPNSMIDAALDSVLKASGSALKHYTTQKMLDEMREAMRKIHSDAYIMGSNDCEKSIRSTYNLTAKARQGVGSW